MVVLAATALLHTGNIVPRAGHISLCQQGTQRTDMVGEFVGQAALGGVGIQQSRSPLLLQFGPENVGCAAA